MMMAPNEISISRPTLSARAPAAVPRATGRVSRTGAAPAAAMLDAPLMGDEPRALHAWLLAAGIEGDVLDRVESVLHSEDVRNVEQLRRCWPELRWLVRTYPRAAIEKALPEEGVWNPFSYVWQRRSQGSAAARSTGGRRTTESEPAAPPQRATGAAADRQVFGGPKAGVGALSVPHAVLLARDLRHSARREVDRADVEAVCV